jgi:hypothetical protein
VAGSQGHGAFLDYRDCAGTPLPQHVETKMKNGVMESWSDGVRVKKEGSDSSIGFAVLQHSNTPVIGGL